MKTESGTFTVHKEEESRGNAKGIRLTEWSCRGKLVETAVDKYK